GFYKRMAAAPSPIPTAPTSVYVQSMDRWTMGGVNDPVNGGWWTLVKEYRIDVREFGAVCDGTTDDAPAIQAAIDYLSNRGGVDEIGVVQIVGTCLISKTIQVKTNLIQICGDGPRQSAIKATTDFGDIVRFGNDIPCPQTNPPTNVETITGCGIFN